MNLSEEWDSSASQISVYTGRGTLVESQGPCWFYGSGSEHSTFYQYQLYKAKNVSNPGLQVGIFANTQRSTLVTFNQKRHTTSRPPSPLSRSIRKRAYFLATRRLPVRAVGTPVKPPGPYGSSIRVTSICIV